MNVGKRTFLSFIFTSTAPAPPRPHTQSADRYGYLCSCMVGLNLQLLFSLPSLSKTPSLMISSPRKASSLIT